MRENEVLGELIDDHARFFILFYSNNLLGVFSRFSCWNSRGIYYKCLVSRDWSLRSILFVLVIGRDRDGMGKPNRDSRTDCC